MLTARDEKKGQGAARELTGGGLDVHFIQLDIANPISVQELASQVDEKPVKLDVLVNNAAAYADFSETASSEDLAHTQEVINTNLFAARRTVQAFLLLLKKGEHARVVNGSSGTGSHG